MDEYISLFILFWGFLFFYLLNRLYIILIDEHVEPVATVESNGWVYRLLFVL